MTPTEIIDELAELNPSAVLWDGFDEALIGIGERCCMEHVAVYDRDKMIEILMEDMSEEEAIEYYEFNILGAWISEHTPILLTVMKGE
jgi:hypothetical protein